MQIGELSELEVEAIEQLDEAILFCKASSNHRMSIVEVREKTWGDEVDYACDICPRERYDTYDPNGELLTRRYNFVPRSKVVGERMLIADFRGELLRRYKLGGMGVAKAKPKRRLKAVSKQA